MNTTALVPYRTSFEETKQIAEVFVNSGMFTNLKTANQAIVKIMAGQELGLGAFASIDGFDIIQGRISPSGNLVAALVRSHPAYDYRVKKSDATGCTLAFYLKNPDGTLGELLGEHSFTEADAKRAGLGGENYKKYPADMFFNRAITSGQKKFCPDVFHGAKVYTPEEITTPAQVSVKVLPPSKNDLEPPAGLRVQERLRAALVEANLDTEWLRNYVGDGDLGGPEDLDDTTCLRTLKIVNARNGALSTS